MATKFQIKRSSVSGRTPNTTNAANSSYIAAGELALNLTDKKMYSSNGTNYFEIGSFKVELVNSTSNVSTFTQISTLQFDEDSGFDVTNPSAGIAKVAINSTFKFWQVDGVQKLTATGLDTVNFIGGNNISITANGANTPQSIAFATSMTPTFTSVTFGNSTVNTTINSSAIAVSKIFANGVVGTAGKVLTSNGTGGIYWGDASSGGAGGDLTIISDTFNGNGSNTVYTLSVSASTDKTFVYLNGVLQAPTTDYSVTGTTLTFVTAPPSDNVIEVRSFDIPSVADLTVTSDNFTGNGSNTQFTLTTSQSSNETSLVFLNGVAQVPTTDYSISGSTLTFTAAPANATNIQVTSYTAEDIVTTTYTGNGSNTQFTLGTTSTTTKTVVSLNGVTQTPTADYSVSGATLVFSVAPANNDKIIARAIPSTTSSTAGSNTNIQYNKSGSPGGSAGFTFNETTNNVTIANTLTVPNFILNASNPPANSTATGTTGTFAWDSTFFYIATGTNTWKKVPITTDGSGGGGSANTAGSNTQVQFNDSGVLGATAGFTFNKDSNNLTVANTLTVARLSANGSTGAGKILAANSTGGLFWSDGGGYGVTRNEFTANGTAVNFTLSRQPFSEEHVLVFVDGIIQRDADISVSGTTLTFAVAPDNLSEIEAFVFQTGAATPGGSNTHIQYNKSDVLGGSAAFTFNEATNTVNLSNTLTIGSNVTVNASAIFIGNSSVNTTITAGNVHLQGTQLTVGNVVVNGSTLTIGSNVTVNTSTIFIGNSSVNTTITAGNVHLQGTQLTVGNTVLTGQQITVGNSTVNSVIRANGATFTGDLMPSANVTYDIGNSAMRWRDLWLSGTTINLGGATIKTDTDTGAIAFVPKATADVPNPKAVVVSPRGGIQAVNTTDGVPIINNSITTVDGVLYGNSTVNTTINSSSVSTIVLNVGSNVFVNTSTIHLGNSTVNTVIHTTGFTGNGAGLHSVNAAALEGNTVANILTAANTAANTLANAAYTNAIAYSGNAAQAYSNATSYADTVAATAFTNAASRADSAYSNAIAYSGNAVQAYNNAVAYAASNTYVNNTFLPLAGGTLTGALTINATANVVSNLSANNVTFRGDVQIDGNLVVSGTSVTLNVATLAVEDNIIHLNNGSTDTHPDLGIAGNYNDGTYKHAGIFRDATDGVWKVFDGYLPEPNTAFIDTSNASFRIADFTANVVTANGFTGNGTNITSVNAATVGGNTASTLRSYSDTVAATAFSNAAARADSAYSNAVSYASNADNISSGTLNTARLPATVNVSTVVNVGANLNINTSSVQIGNSTANIVFSQSTVTINGVSHSFESIVNTATGANSVMIRNSAGDSAVGSRFHFTSAVADGGTFGIIGLNWGGAANTFKNFEVYDYVNARPMFRSYGETRNFEIFGTVNAAALILTTNTATFGTAVNIVANGNVGIGSATPISRLTVESNDFTAGEVFLAQLCPQGTDGSVAMGYVANGTVDLYGFIRSRHSVDLGLGAGSATHIFIKQGGNVGIGTTTPGTTLAVNGTISFVPSVGNHVTLGNDGTYGTSGTGRYVTLGLSGSADTANRIFAHNTGQDGIFICAATGQAIQLRPNGNTTSSFMAAANGNVGIGTTSPAQKLHVEGTGTVYALVRSSSTSGSRQGGIILNVASTGGNDPAGKIDFTYGNSYTSAAYIEAVTQTNALIIGIGGTERMRFDSSGNVTPGANGTQNFGSSSLRWATVYTSDLDLSNGVGDWTIVEGEDDLFIYNNKRGKVYKFKLEEVDPSTATPKKENQ